MKHFMKIAAALFMLSVCQFGWAMESELETFTYCSGDRTVTAHSSNMQKEKRIINTYIALLGNQALWGKPTEIVISNISNYKLLRYPNGMDKYELVVKAGERSLVKFYYVYKNLPIYWILYYTYNAQPEAISCLVEQLPAEIAQSPAPYSSTSASSSSSSSSASAATTSTSTNSVTVTTAPATASAQSASVMASASNSSTEEEMEPGAYVPTTIQTTACSCIESKSE